MASVTFLKRIGVLSLVPATGQNVVGTANASQPGQPTELVRGEEFRLQTATAERGAVLIRRPVLYPAELRARMGGSVSVASLWTAYRLRFCLKAVCSIADESATDVQRASLNFFIDSCSPISFACK